MKKRSQRTKPQLLAESREKTLTAQADHRGSIRLDDMERMAITGILARQREVQVLMEPIHADLNKLGEILNRRYQVVMDQTHRLNTRTLELDPLPPPPAQEQAAAPSEANADPLRDAVDQVMKATDELVSVN